MKKSNALKGLVAALAMLLCANGPMGVLSPATVKAVDTGIKYEPTVPKAVLADTLKPYKAKPGDTVKVVVPVKASNYTIRKPIIEVDLSKTSDFKLASDPFFYTKDNKNPSSITVTETAFVEFSVYIPLNAKKGTYKDIPIKFITTDSFNDYTEVLLNQVSKLTFVVEEQRKLAEFSLVNVDVPEEVMAEDDFSIDVSLENRGELSVKNVSVTLEGYDSLFRIEGSQPTGRLGDFAPRTGKAFSYNLIAGKSLNTTLIPLTLTVKYEHEDGSVAEAQVFKFSLQTIAKEEKKEPAKRPVIQVTNVEYPRRTILPNEEFDLVYTFKNTGKVDAKNVTIDVKGYSEAGFKPAKAYDKKRISLLKAGESVEFKLSLKAIESIQSGIKPVVAEFSYFSVEDKEMATTITDSINTYLDAKAKEDEKAKEDLNNSVPRLMIAKYSTGDEKIMAGKIFNFSFDVLNSHSSVSADNIKATVSSADGNFAIVEGSASFYISSLKAGEMKNLTIPLKVKGDIATNGYDVNIKFEYEYLKKDTTNNNALTKQTTELTEALKLQVFSNDRPKLTNIRVGDGEPPKHMEVTNLTFDFNNMGKSPLYNVTAEIKGDFKPMNEVLIIGNVNPGEGKSWSVEVTPMMENMGSGILTISYEDGNGNVTSYDTDFNSEVVAPDTSMPDMSDMPNLPQPEEKKDVMPLWAFVGGNILVFIIAAAISKSVIVKKYKKKKRAEIEKEDEEL